MSEALHLFPLAPTLTPRQQAAHKAIQQAGYDGLHTDEVGAVAHAWAGKHPADELCPWCGSAGMELGRALRAKGLVQQRRRRDARGQVDVVWTVAGRLPSRSYPGMSDTIPY